MSVRREYNRDKPKELEALHGAVVRRGNEHEVDVPMNEAAYAILRPWAKRNQRNKG